MVPSCFSLLIERSKQIMDVEERSTLVSGHQLRSDADIDSRVIRKLDRHFLLLLVGVVFVSYLDRGNIGYVANDLCKELSLNHEEYGRGVSLFFFGYLVTQVVGNVMLKRLGAPLWISFIVFAWGCVAAAMGFLQNKMHFYVLRVLLGIAEGGTFPAIYYTITVFYPPLHATNAYSVIISSVAFSMPVSAPISAGLVGLGTCLGVEGWRLLFIVEGLLPIIHSIILFIFMPASPESASFLEADEKEWIAAEHCLQENASALSFWQEAKSVVACRTWRFCTVCVLMTSGIGSILMFWATLIIHDMLYPDEDDEESATCGTENGNAALAILLTAIPFLITGTVSLLPRYYTVQNRARFSSFVSCFGGVMLICWVSASHTVFIARFLFLTCALAALHLAAVYFIGLAMTSCKASIRSTAASLFVMTGTVGAAVFPLVFGKLMDVFGSGVAFILPTTAYFVAALLALCVKDPLIENQANRTITSNSSVG